MTNNADKVLQAVFDADNNSLRTGLALTGDVEIGGVEIKDGTTDTRAKVADGTTIVAADNALAVHDPVLGLSTDAAVTTDITGSISARIRGLVNIIVARLPALGQAAMAASMPVAIASNQSAVAMSATQL